MGLVDSSIQYLVTRRIEALENHFGGDVAFFYGPIDLPWSRLSATSSKGLPRRALYEIQRG